MAQRATSLTILTAFVLAAGLWLIAPSPASAAPLSLAAPFAPVPLVQDAQIYKRGRPPVYPYVYRRGRPGGWDFYFGPVPYLPGNIETQALQRRYPQLNYPPSMRYWNPQSQF